MHKFKGDSGTRAQPSGIGIPFVIGIATVIAIVIIIAITSVIIEYDTCIYIYI